MATFPNRKKPVSIGYREHQAIDALLKEYLHTVDEAQKLYSYETGWSDVRVADTVGGLVNTNHVNVFRNKYYGRLFARPTPSAPGEANQSLANKFDDIAHVLYVMLGALSRENLISGIEESDLSATIETLVKKP